MPKLTHKNYVPKEIVPKVDDNIKDEIKAIVQEGSVEYEAIVKEIKKTHMMTKRQIEKQIKEVSVEENFTGYRKPVVIIEKPVEEIIEVEDVE